MVINKEAKTYTQIFIVSLLVLSILFVSFVFAYTHIASKDSTMSSAPNESLTNFYNISIILNNTGFGGANITQVNITLSTGFLYLMDSYGNRTNVSNFDAFFVNDSASTNQTLSWKNASDGLLNESLRKVYFWFNATASYPGNWTLNVTSWNSTMAVNTTFYIMVNDTTRPANITHVTGGAGNNSNQSMSIPINITAWDADARYGNLTYIKIRVYNASRDQVTNATSGLMGKNNGTFFFNFTGSDFNLGDGCYYINATVNDSYGNFNATYNDTRNITVDGTVPLIAFNGSTPSNYANKSLGNNISVSVDITEIHMHTVVFRLYYANSTWGLNVTNRSGRNFKINWTGLADGEYLYNVTVNDSAGNSNTTATRNMTIDTTAPSNVTFITGSGVNNSNYSKSIPINITAWDAPVGAGLGHIQYIKIILYNASRDQVSNATSGLMSNTNATFFYNFTGSDFNLADGCYYINATANDTAGNSNNTVPFRNITFDGAIPVIAFNGSTPANNSNLSYQTWIDVSINVTDSTMHTVVFNLSHDNSTGAINYTNKTGREFKINWTGLSDGTYVYTAWVNDSAGNKNITTHKVTLDHNAPGVDYSCTPTSAGVGQVITCTCSGTDPSLGYTGVETTTYTISPSTSAVGSFTTNCNVTDYAGNSNVETISYTVNPSGGGGGGGGGGGSGITWSTLHTVTADEFEEGYTKEIKKNQRVKVTVKDETHYVGVTGLTSSTVSIEISSAPQTATLSVGDVRKFDVDLDGYYDLSVTLNSITGSKADMTVKSISELVPVTEEAQEEEAEKQEEAQEIKEAEKEKEEAQLTWLWIVIGIIVVAILVGVGYGSKKKSQ